MQPSSSNALIRVVFPFAGFLTVRVMVRNDTTARPPCDSAKRPKFSTSAAPSSSTSSSAARK